jgi:hypothetical protein
MGSDLFSSFAEASVASLVISGGSRELLFHGQYYYPLIISASGILVCLLTTLFIPLFSFENSAYNYSSN